MIIHETNEQNIGIYLKTEWRLHKGKNPTNFSWKTVNVWGKDIQAVLAKFWSTGYHHSHRHRVGWKRGPAHPQTTSRARGTVVFLLLTQAAPWEEVPDQGTCSHGLVGSCFPGGGPPPRMGHAVTFRGAEYLLCPGGFGTNILTWSSEQPV